MNRGRPLPFSIRQDIKTLTKHMPIKVVARALGISHVTVRKYKFVPRRDERG